jgi:hypothetical protein
MRDMVPKRELAARLAAAIRRVKEDNATAKRMDARTRDVSMGPLTHLNRWNRKMQNRLYKNPDYDGHVKKLEDLLSMLHGKVVELRESKENRVSVRWLFRDGKDTTLRGSGNVRMTLVPWPAQGGAGTAIQADGLATAWKDRAYATFPAVDVTAHREREGRLRFYVNGGRDGGHDLSFSLALDSGGSKGSRHVKLGDYVTVDGLEATWQLVDIPLADLLPEGEARVCGFNMGYSQRYKIAGPLWIDSMYVCLPAEPEPVRAPVQERSARPATRAQLEPVLVRTDKFVGGEGTESRITLPLRLTGDGRLTDVRILLRILGQDGKPFLTHPLLEARELRTP